MSSASRPIQAAQVESATTATPMSISTTARTPGTASAALESRLASLPPTKTGPARHRRVEHPRQAHVAGVDGLAGDIGRVIDLALARADDPELAGLSSSAPGCPHGQQGGRLGQRAVGQALAAGVVDHLAQFGAALGRVDAPGRRAALTSIARAAAPAWRRVSTRRKC
jgi:hypothetical protein